MQLLILPLTGYETDLETFSLVSYHAMCLKFNFKHVDDHCRVKLEEITGIENSDYINASYLDVGNHY